VIASRQEIRGPDVARHYDELDRFYRDIWGQHVHHGLWLRGDESRDLAVRQLAEMVAREAGVGEGTRVIDIGCGYGETARLFAKEFGADVTGMTISEAQYAIAAAKDEGGRMKDEVPTSSSAPQGILHPSSFILHPSFVLGDWLANDLPAESFDAGIAIESSEHMPDKPAFFAQAHRVLRSGGKLVVCSWLSCESPTRNQVRWLIEPICREGRMPEIGTANDYRRLAADAQFEVERYQDVTRQIARTWPMIVRVFLWNLLRKPAYLRFILDPASQNAIFAITIVRLWIAFRTGAMRYGVFTLRKK
jgi:tocopherol O-methyltransferase